MRRWASGRWEIGVAVWLLAVCLPAGVARGQDEGAVPVCCPGVPPEQEPAMGTLAVMVQLVAGGGAQPPPGLAPTGPPPRPASGVVVQALATDTAAVAGEAVSDPQGQAALDVPPGHYWVVVPVAGQQGGLPGGALAMETPSGVRVHAYQEAMVAAGETVTVDLTVRIMLP